MSFMRACLESSHICFARSSLTNLYWYWHSRGVRQDPNLKVDPQGQTKTDNNLYRLNVELSDSQLSEKRRLVSARVSSLAQDGRPEARQLFEELLPGGSYI